MASVIRGAALTPRPWPNGLGITRDVTGQNQRGAQFDWLLSIADLRVDAAFSDFPGCDRIFTLIEGGDVTLTLDGVSPMPCLTLVPASFPGDRPTFCAMGAGPARAFNVFVDRGHFTARVAVRTIAASHAIRTGAVTAAIYCVSGVLDIAGETLAAGDTLTGTGATRICAAGEAALALIVEIEALGQA
jgi:environmental stress-induced protein Ves